MRGSRWTKRHQIELFSVQENYVAVQYTLRLKDSLFRAIFKCKLQWYLSVAVYRRYISTFRTCIERLGTWTLLNNYGHLFMLYLTLIILVQYRREPKVKNAPLCGWFDSQICGLWKSNCSDPIQGKDCCTYLERRAVVYLNSKRQSIVWKVVCGPGHWHGLCNKGLGGKMTIRDQHDSVLESSSYFGNVACFERLHSLAGYAPEDHY